MKIERIREKLSQTLKERGYSKRAVSLRAGLIHNAVANIVSRNQERVNYAHLEKILQVLGVSFAEFWEPDDGPSEPPKMTAPAGMRFTDPPQATVMVPHCGTISAGPFRLVDPDTTQHFYAGTRDDAGSFALTISGNSMTPDYCDGEVILVRRVSIHLVPLPRGVQVGVPYEHVKPLNGKDCVVLMGDEGSTFKRLSIEKGPRETYALTLLPVNVEHNKTVVRPDHDVWIQGVCYKSVRNH